MRPAGNSPERHSFKWDLIAMVASMLFGLVCVVVVVCVIRCAIVRRKKQLDSGLPRIVYRGGGGVAEGGGEGHSAGCAICQEEFAEGEELRVLPECGHWFHAGCIDEWFMSRSSCPSCRHVVAAAAAPPRTVAGLMFTWIYHWLF